MLSSLYPLNQLFGWLHRDQMELKLHPDKILGYSSIAFIPQVGIVTLVDPLQMSKSLSSLPF
jgi:hypothetical protein